MPKHTQSPITFVLSVSAVSLKRGVIVVPALIEIKAQKEINNDNAM